MVWSLEILKELNNRACEKAGPVVSACSSIELQNAIEHVLHVHDNGTLKSEPGESASIEFLRAAYKEWRNDFSGQD
jgi:hypothetical protein